MYKERDKVRIERIVLDLHDVIADSKKVVVFEYEIFNMKNNFSEHASRSTFRTWF